MLEIVPITLKEANEAEVSAGGGRKRLTIQQEIQIVDLAATYEELYAIPESQRLTFYFGDYGQHFLLPGVTDEQLEAVCKKALDVIGLTEEEFLAREGEFMYRNNIITAMKGLV